ncbi:hypothetical protein [Cohnella fermenti]|uniref:Spore coat protein n=1 Tax=Cohnella fermenti TaxID=2565925 RepID=A0A4S4BHV2_9BACL|nr:hypothetical protein [Cohnella fermenti]THF73529.1 hypothetical protein E6C55_29010 [Cohnella fermenti]
MWRWIGWAAKLAASAVLLSFLCIWTTGYIVNSYLQTVVKQLDIPLDVQPFALSGVWGTLWGADKPDAQEAEATGEPPPDQPVFGDDGAIDSGGTLGEASASPGAESSAEEAEAGADGGTANEEAGETGNGSETSVDTPKTGEAIPVFGNEAGGDESAGVGGLESVLSDEDRQRLISLVVSKLDSEQLRQLSSYLEGGVDASELPQLQALLKEALSEQEYEQMMAIIQGQNTPEEP